MVGISVPGDGVATIFDSRTMEVAAEATPIGPNPLVVVVHPSGQIVYIVSTNDAPGSAPGRGAVYVYSASLSQIGAKIPVGGGS